MSQAHNQKPVTQERLTFRARISIVAADNFVEKCRREVIDDDALMMLIRR